MNSEKQLLDYIPEKKKITPFWPQTLVLAHFKTFTSYKHFCPNYASCGQQIVCVQSVYAIKMGKIQICLGH